MLTISSHATKTCLKSSLWLQQKLCDRLSLRDCSRLSSELAESYPPRFDNNQSLIAAPNQNEPDYQQLKAVENHVVAVGFAIFGNDLATETKKGAKCLAVIY